jgi:hypothetical protein
MDRTMRAFDRESAGFVRRGLLAGLALITLAAALSVGGTIALVYGIIKVLQITGVI